MLERTNKVGRHLPTSGGLHKTLDAARRLGCETVQIFVSNPQGWAVPAPRRDAELFAQGSEELGLAPVVAHAKYLINLASPNEELRRRSVRALADELATATTLGVDFVVVHAGSHGGEDEEKGLDRLVAGLVAAKEQAVNLAASNGRVTEPAIENSVGAGTQLCSTFGALGEVARRAGVRVCVDTAHAFVAGSDFSTPESVRRTTEEIGESVGDALALVHLNDATHAPGSHRDGHRKVREGQVPPDAWPELFARLPGVPLVMETPYGTSEEDEGEMRLVKELAGGLRLTPSGG